MSTQQRPGQRRLASQAIYARRLWRNALWALFTVVVALVVGMVGYAWFGDMGLAQAFANAAMILSGMGPLDKLPSPAGMVFEGLYALVSGFLFFGAAGLALAPALHRILHRFHLEDSDGESR